MNFFKNVKNGLKNLKTWFFIIWKDRNWDHEFLYIMLKHKLKNMEKFFLSNEAYALYAKNEAKNIGICIELLNRLINGNYHENGFIHYYRKWGDFESYTKNDEFKMNLKNVKTKEDKIQEKKEATRLYKHVEMMEKQDLNYLFKIMNKHIQNWWD